MMVQRLTVYSLLSICLLNAFGFPMVRDDNSNNTPTERHYYIRAEDTSWNYAPNIHTDLYGGNIQGNFTMNRTLYYGYTNDTWAEKIPIEAPYHGDLGPVIRAQVGDLVVIHFMNAASRPVTIHAHGVKYQQTNEGMMNPVAPGGNFTYTWMASDRSGPPVGSDSILWTYHSHVTESDVYAGLIGPIVIYAKGKMGTRNQEVFVKSIIDVYEEATRDNPREVFAINGYVYGNLPEINLTIGSTVTWHLLAFGDEADIHAMHWHGNVVKTDANRNVDVVHLFPASFQTVTMVPDVVGTWMYHCHVIEHFENGMYAYYTTA